MLTGSLGAAPLPESEAAALLNWLQTIKYYHLRDYLRDSIQHLTLQALCNAYAHDGAGGCRCWAKTVAFTLYSASQLMQSWNSSSDSFTMLMHNPLADVRCYSSDTKC